MYDVHLSTVRFRSALALQALGARTVSRYSWCLPLGFTLRAFAAFVPSALAR